MNPGSEPQTITKTGSTTAFLAKLLFNDLHFLCLGTVCLGLWNGSYELGYLTQTVEKQVHGCHKLICCACERPTNLASIPSFLDTRPALGGIITIGNWSLYCGWSAGCIYWSLFRGRC